MNGNIYGYSLSSASSEPYEWDCGWLGCYSAYPIPPAPPANTINGEPIFAQSYINAYNTAFNQETSSFSGNYQEALYNYHRFTSSDVNSNFVDGTFGYKEEYNGQGSNLGNSITINYLQDNANYYDGTPY
jgi:hypothetical protein